MSSHFVKNRIKAIDPTRHGEDVKNYIRKISSLFRYNYQYRYKMSLL
jgi:hypothetical protein